MTKIFESEIEELVIELLPKLMKGEVRVKGFND